MTETLVVHHDFTIHPDWVMPFPDDWLMRLRQISPIVDATSHLWPRYRSEAGQWELYQCIPKALLDPYRVEQLTVHWTAMPKRAQMGRQTLCSEYQHYMFRTHGVDAQRFWVLQGSAGGTPHRFTDREQSIRKLHGWPEEPPPMGVLEAAPFDERAVDAILSRDALHAAGMSLANLAEHRTGDGQRKEEAEAEQEYRKAFLAYIDKATEDQVDLAKFILKNPQITENLPQASNEDLRLYHSWKDDYLATGVIPGPGRVSTSLATPRSFQ